MKEKKDNYPGNTSTRQKDKIIKFVKKVLPFLGLLIFIYLVADIGLDKIVSAFLSLSPIYIVIVALLTIPRIIIRNIAWQMILKQQRMHIDFVTSLKIFLIGYFYATITPGYLGQLMRIPYLKDETGEPFGKLFVNTFIETSLHTLSLYGMMLIGTLLIIRDQPMFFYGTLTFIMVLLFIYWFFYKENRGKKFFNFFVKYMIPKKYKISAGWVVDSLYKDFPKIRMLVYPFLMGIVTWIIMFSQIYIIGLSLDIKVSYLHFLVLYPIANVISFIPITSAGFGTREATVIFLLGLLGVAPEKALVLSIVGFLITDMLTGFYGFIISLLEGRKNKMSLKFI